MIVKSSSDDKADGDGGRIPNLVEGGGELGMMLRLKFKGEGCWCLNLVGLYIGM